MSADGSDARRVTPGRWHVHGLSWLDRGELLFTAGDLFSQRGYSVRVAEGTPYPLPGLGDNDRLASGEISDVFHGSGGALYPSVSADEKTLLVAKEPFRASELWLLENFRR